MKKPKRPRGFNSSLPARTKGMPRGRGPKRKATVRKPRKRLPRKNVKRQAKRSAEELVYGPFYEEVRSSGPCLLAGSPGHICIGRIDAHHVQHAGNGGVDAMNLVKLCRGAHRLSRLSVHCMGRDSFEEYWKVDLEFEALMLWLGSKAMREQEGWVDLNDDAAPRSVSAPASAPRPHEDGTGANSTKEVISHEVIQTWGTGEYACPAGGSNEPAGGIPHAPDCALSQGHELCTCRIVP